MILQGAVPSNDHGLATSFCKASIYSNWAEWDQEAAYIFVIEYRLGQFSSEHRKTKALSVASKTERKVWRESELEVTQMLPCMQASTGNYRLRPTIGAAGGQVLKAGLARKPGKHLQPSCT